MLLKAIQYCHNYFCKPENVVDGTFKIENGSISLPFLVDGQYFRIVGSVLNDGVFQYPPMPDALLDEEFQGEIWPMAIPRDFLRVVTDMEAWYEKNGEASPFQSESFGGYSYSRGSGVNGNVADVFSVFANRLKAWRKL